MYIRTYTRKLTYYTTTCIQTARQVGNERRPEPVTTCPAQPQTAPANNSHENTPKGEIHSLTACVARDLPARSSLWKCTATRNFHPSKAACRRRFARALGCKKEQANKRGDQRFIRSAGVVVRPHVAIKRFLCFVHYMQVFCYFHSRC